MAFTSQSECLGIIIAVLSAGVPVESQRLSERHRWTLVRLRTAPGFDASSGAMLPAVAVRSLAFERYQTQECNSIPVASDFR